jgi:2,3-bisphosphoglycerate-independent phosphoglycerate mutase
MTIHSISTDGANNITIHSSTEIYEYQGMKVILLGMISGLYQYYAGMDSIESIMAQRAIDKALEDALKA